MAPSPQPTLDPVAASEPSSRAGSASACRSVLFWSAALLILVFDLWSKSAVFAHLGMPSESLDRFAKIEDDEIAAGREPGAGIAAYYQGRPYRQQQVFGTQIRFVAMLNPGMMWGAFDEYPGVLKVVRPAAVLVIFLLLSSLPAGQRAARIALGGILGGALGNIYDSFRYLGVRDFLEVDLDVPVFDPFPAFNVADAAICVGVAVLALGMMFGNKPEPHAPAAT